MRKLHFASIIFLSFCLCIGGCSFSKSSKQSSRSSSSPCRSSSAKQAADTAESSYSYHEEIAAMTTLYVGSAKSALEYQRDLSTISNKYGLVDWVSNPETYRAIGLGLKRAGVPRESIRSLPFLQNLNVAQYYPEITAGYR